MTHEELKKKIEKIVQDAIERQMDWEAYYEGIFEKPTEEIMNLIEEYKSA